MRTLYEVKQGSGEWEVRVLETGKVHSAWKKLSEARKAMYDLNRVRMIVAAKRSK